MFMAEIIIPNIAGSINSSVSATYESLEESINWLNKVATNNDYCKAEISNLATNKIILTLRVVK